MSSLVVEAVYENGVLRPSRPLPLREHEKVRVAIQAQESSAERTAGLMGFNGTTEVADYFALAPDLDALEGS